MAQLSNISSTCGIVLSVALDGTSEKEVFLQHGLSIVRNPSNTIFIDDPAIDRIHSQVICQPDGTMVLQCQTPQSTILLPDGKQVSSFSSC